MTLPYSRATSGQKAIGEIQKILRNFGCAKFANGTDFETGVIFIQFEHRGRMLSMNASPKGYAAAWLLENPWSRNRQSNLQQWEEKALTKGEIAAPSILRDWVKAQVTAIEIGIFTFEEAFLPHIIAPSGKRVIEEVTERKLLPVLEDNS